MKIISEDEAPTRAEFATMLDAEKQKPSYKAKDKAGKEKHLKDAHKAFCTSKGMTAVEADILATDIPSYEIPAVIYSDRQA